MSVLAWACRGVVAEREAGGVLFSRPFELAVMVANGRPDGRNSCTAGGGNGHAACFGKCR